MEVKIIKISQDPVSSCTEAAKIWYPDLKIESTSNIQQYIKKLIRERSQVLNSCNITLSIKLPFFTYFTLLNIMGWKTCNILPFDIEDISFETKFEFKDKELSSLACLFKKVKSILKDLNYDQDSFSKIMYFLPLSTHIKIRNFMTFLQLYELMEKTKDSGIPKLMELSNDIMNILNTASPIFFKPELLEIFIANKEK